MQDVDLSRGNSLGQGSNKFPVPEMRILESEPEITMTLEEKSVSNNEKNLTDGDSNFGAKNQTSNETRPSSDQPENNPQFNFTMEGENLTIFAQFLRNLNI